MDETDRPGERRPLTFEEFYAVEYPAMVALGYKLTGNDSEAEDLAQEAFFRAHQRWSTIGRYDKPGAWMRRVVVNLATSRSRRVKSSALTMLRLRQQRPATGLPLSASTIEFWHVVRTLPPRQAQVVALYYEADRPVSDVAAILRCAEGTVRAHLHAARRTLAIRLAEDEGGRL